MPFIQENLIEINLGLKNQYKIIHFSDVHASTYRDSDKKEVIEEAIKAEETWYKQKPWFANKANELCEECHMIPSKECLEKIIDYVNEEKPIGVVLTGDIIDYYSESNYDMLLSECGKINYPFVFSCGNHETPAERFMDLTYDINGFSVLEFNEFKIVSLDNSTKKVNKETLDNLKEELEDNLPIIIAMHIPLATSYNRDKMIEFGEYFSIDEDNTDSVTKEFIDLLKNDNRIKAILCGHVHAKSETEFMKNKKQYCASSGLIGLVNKIIVK